MASRRSKPARSPQHISETSPNPHGEQDVLEMPVQTDHSHHTSHNVSQNPSTKGNRLNPSIAGPLEETQEQENQSRKKRPA